MDKTLKKTATATTAVSASSPSAPDKSTPGLRFTRHFTHAGVSPYDEVTWEYRDAVIQNYKGNTIFEQKKVEVPSDWSMTATNIVASKYLHGLNGTDERESGVRALITRVAESIRDWGMRDGFFATDIDAATFYDELCHLLLNQKVAFNSPVWFNVGCDRLEPKSDAQNWHWDAERGAIAFSRTGYTKPQCSACFINSVNDSLDSILTLAKTEGMLFKWGSGAGSNLSAIRGSMETLSGGGTASGPLSFMRGFDAFAGVIKSGGKTRRAAKMVILNIDHPDIEDFIECKVKEEKKAWTLVQAGYDGSGPDSEAYSSIFFQNANNSVRVTDEFMHAVETDGMFSTRTVKGREAVKQYRARDLMLKIAEATWQCGDPGMQYDTTINRWHTSKNTARINASNPCSEYMFLDDSACNLASFNLLKFLTPGGQFDVPSYRHAIAIVTTAMEIIVDAAGYPTEQIAKNSHDYRPLGLGYANLGALLMAFGLPYDSDAGRDYAATLTSILCGDAYWQSARIAESCPALGAATPLTQSVEIEGGACPGFYVNREPFLDVIRMHRAEVNNIGKSRNSDEPFLVLQLDQLIEASTDAWDGALAHGEKFGYRNSQVTVLAPTGTIGFMMDCDTTGIEPDLALVKFKKLVGGGMIKLVNNTVPSALIKLGYRDADVNAIVSYIDATGTIEGAPGIRPEHLAVFDCSFKPSKGTRSIHYMGHIKMMAATQPFLSGAISKTVNLPQDASVENIAEAYVESWRQGLKAVAIYRDGSKGSQPLNVSASDGKAQKEEKAIAAPAAAPSAESVAAIAAQAQQLQAKTEQVQTQQQKIAALEAQLKAMVAPAAAQAQQLKAKTDQVQNQQQQIAVLEAQLKANAEAATQNADAAELQVRQQQVAALEAQLKANADAAELQNQQQKIAALEAQLKAIAAPAAENVATIATQAQQLQAKVDQVQNQQQQIAALDAQLKAIAAPAAENVATIAAQTQQLQAKTEQVQNQQQQIAALETQLEAIAAPAAAQAQQLHEKTEQVEVQQQQIAVLDALLAAAQQEAMSNKLKAAEQAARLAPLEAQLMAVAEAATRNADAIDATSPPRAVRNRLPGERASITHKFGLSGHEGYITVGLYPNGQPGEIFIRMAKEGSTVSGLMDSFATAVSLALQHGVPLKVLCEKFAHTRFEPSGWTGNEQIGYAKSIMDYIFRWLQLRFLSGTQLDLFAGLQLPGHSAELASGNSGQVIAPDSAVVEALPAAADSAAAFAQKGESTDASGSPATPEYYLRTTPPQEGIAPDLAARSGMEPASSFAVEDRGLVHAADAMRGMYEMGDAPSCATCGAIMVRNGSCYRCMSCGSTSGCS